MAEVDSRTVARPRFGRRCERRIGTLPRRPARGGGMSESSTLSVPAGLPAETLTLPVAQGRRRESFTPQRVIALLAKGQHTPRRIDELRARLKHRVIPCDAR